MYLKDKVAQISSDATKRYFEDGIEPAKTISKHAEMEKLSSLQIDRVVNKTNRNIIVELQKEAAKKDPHFTFPTAKTAEVIGMIDTRAKAKLPDRKKIDRLPLPTIGKDEELSKLKDNLSKVAESKVELMRTRAAVDNAIIDLYKTASSLYMETPYDVMDSVRSNFDNSAGVNKAFRLAFNETGKHMKLASAVDFEVDRDHPLFKKAERVAYLEEMLSVVEETHNGYRRLCR